MYRGYIKLWRCIADNPITKKPEYISVWIYLLYSVNHSDSEIIFNNKKMLIKSGSMITSRAKIAENTGVQESKVERILKYLKTEQQIEQQSFSKYRIISICNWPKYQQTEQQNEQPVNSKRTASEQQVNTNKNDKNDKNDKNEKNIYVGNTPTHKHFLIPAVEEISAYCQHRDNQVNAEKFFDFYSAKGWMIGKNKMKDWKAAVRTWEQKDSKPNKKEAWEI